MEPHRAATDCADDPRRSVEPGKPRRGDREAMNADWLDRKAIDYAARWETTEWGVARLLERKIQERCDRTNESPESALALIPETISKLVARRYVDDRRAAEQLILRLERQGRSRAQIRARLLAKGVTDSMATELLQSESSESIESELRAAWKTARKRRLGPHSPDPEQRAANRNRHLGVLSRQGFTIDVATQVIDGDLGSEGILEENLEGR